VWSIPLKKLRNRLEMPCFSGRQLEQNRYCMLELTVKVDSSLDNVVT
jgi:hypothetical protein